MLKLNDKLFKFIREETYIYDIQNNFFLKKLTPNPDTDMCSKFICEKDFRELEN